MIQAKRNRPAGNGTDPSIVLAAGCSNTSIIPEPAHRILDGSYSIVVVTQIDPEHQRRRVFYTLKSAERAVQRAKDNGQHADIVLCRLEPVQVVL